MVFKTVLSPSPSSRPLVSLQRLKTCKPSELKIPRRIQLIFPLIFRNFDIGLKQDRIIAVPVYQLERYPLTFNPISVYSSQITFDSKSKSSWIKTGISLPNIRDFLFFYFPLLICSQKWQSTGFFMYTQRYTLFRAFTLYISFHLCELSSDCLPGQSSSLNCVDNIFTFS